MTQMVDNELDFDLTVPDPFDDGLPCACASALAAFWHKDAVSTLNWFENLAHRLWLPAAWDQAYDLTVASLNLNRIAGICAQAVMAAGASYEAYGHGQDATWQKSMSQIAELMAPREGEQVLSGPDRFDALYHPVVCVTIKDDAMLKRLSSAALSLRYLWLARFHERNGRWDPVYDWACARRNGGPGGRRSERMAAENGSDAH